MADIPLWELPEDGRPCPFTGEEGARFESWKAFRDHIDDFDDELNVVIWWDWYEPDDDHPNETFAAMLALPNLGRVDPLLVDVTRDDEPEIREWLQARLSRLIGWWQISNEDVASRG